MPAARWTCWPRCRTSADFSVGCYCENEARCHRSLLRELLEERGAKIREIDRVIRTRRAVGHFLLLVKNALIGQADFLATEIGHL